MDCFIDVVNDKPSSNPFCSELNNLDQLAIGYVTLMTKRRRSEVVDDNLRLDLLFMSDRKDLWINFTSQYGLVV
jgi:hypothetical protein